jgi:Uma2 family endonuclease
MLRLRRSHDKGTIMKPDNRSGFGDPTWEVAHRFPCQGSWSSADYLALDTNHLVEMSEGRLEVLAVPTEEHQLLVAFMYEALKSFVAARSLGIVLFAPLRIQLWEGKYREPDVVFLLATNAAKRGDRCWRGADLVMEVVSEDDPDRDLVVKREEYAQAGIAEYWIIDPRDSTMIVLGREEHAVHYAYQADYHIGDVAQSRLLPGFEVRVSDVFSPR